MPVDDRRVGLRQGGLQVAAGVCYDLRGLVRGRPEEDRVVQLYGVTDNDCNGVTLDWLQMPARAAAKQYNGCEHHCWQPVRESGDMGRTD